MKRAAISTALCFWTLAVGAPALSQEPPRIVDIRVGRHAEYDRLVLEFEASVELSRLARSDEGVLVIEVEARPLLPYQALHTAYARVGSLVVREIPKGARIEVEAGAHRVRIFRLSNPPRVVLDFADPGAEPFPLPPGTEPVPEPAPSSAPLPEVAGPAPPEPSGAEAAPEAELSEVSAPAEVAAPELLVPRSEELAPPPLAPPPLPSGDAVGAAPGSALPPGWLERLGGGPVAGLATLGLVLSLLAWFRLRSWRSPRVEVGVDSHPADWPRAPETITPEELAGASDQVDLLGRRIDQEVRARMHLEEGLSQMREELKVMRDRLQRAGRRGDGAS